MQRCLGTCASPVALTKRIMFLVVELCQSQEVVVVPESWTSEQRNSTLWPPYQSAVQLNKAVRSQELPGVEWDSRAIRTIHMADSYNKAKRKMAQVGQQGTGSNGSVGLRRSERLKRAASQLTNTQEGNPAPKRRRTNNSESTPLREPSPPPQPVRRSPRIRRPPPQTPQPRTRSRRQAQRSTARSQQRSPASQRLVLVLDRLDKSLSECVDVFIALDKQIRYLHVVLCLLTALKKCVMLQEMLDKLVYILDRVMERVQLSDQVPYLEMIPELVVREIIQFVQREAEMESDDEEEEEESSVAREE